MRCLSAKLTLLTKYALILIGILNQCIPKLAKDRAVHKEDTPCFLVNTPIKVNAYFINNVNFALNMFLNISFLLLNVAFSKCYFISAVIHN
jgi:hypothetical protein